ncbi:DUF29 domain-containing protein [Nostoc sp. CHAB 5715]|uniref:DUF29 domain-containing protein n=1 Tax=Nostoc sp. CHAB 5715 TaxID=2780400 RepID=UPI001E43CD25|nr:DUF29 domain-containing protein [Nostoc sp. CHAB 5715]MCC5625460.1 DUF29 domain-containing protein [Nostoc sp. CHAB 5715]
MNHQTNATYKGDFYAWLYKSAELLRRRQFSELDLEQIAEELEGMARSDKRQLINRFAVLLAHLLKWQYQSEKRSKSWERTIKEQRKRISLLLEDSPSLRHEIEQKLADAYEIAVLSAANETGLDEDYLPESCEYTLDEVLNSGFYPD